MGKKSAINSLSKIIANITLHKLLLKYTNKPESVNHLTYEVIEYRDTAISRADEFNWNQKNKDEIKRKAKDKIKNLSKKYSDVTYTDEDVNRMLEETFNEVI